MKNTLFALMLLATISTSFEANAAVGCVGSIDAMYIQYDGPLMIKASYRGDYTELCSTITTWKGIDPMLCMQWLSLAKTAMTEHKTIIIYYSSDELSCSSLATFTASPPPYYFGFLP